MSTTLRTDQISKLIQEGARIIDGSNQNISDEYGYNYVTIHQVVHSEIRCIIRDKVVFDLGDFYVEIWYNTKYTKTSASSKLYVPSFTVEVRFYDKNELSKLMGRNHIRGRFSSVEEYVLCEIELVATIKMQRNKTIYQDTEGNLMFDWDVDANQPPITSPCPFIDSADVIKLGYGLEDETVLKSWGLERLRDIISNASDAGFPLPKRRCVFK